jgi:hypothetical protein
VGFGFGLGCGSDSGGNAPDAPVIGGGTGGATARLDGGVVGAGGAVGDDAMTGAGGVTGAGGSVGVDASMATGGAGGAMVDGGTVDANIADAPMGGADSGTGSEAGAVGEAGSAGEAGVVTNICTGLSAAACDQAIRTASVDTTVVTPSIPNTSPPAFSACSQ